jgi:hypothetical protein
MTNKRFVTFPRGMLRQRINLLQNRFSINQYPYTTLAAFLCRRANGQLLNVRFNTSEITSSFIVIVKLPNLLTLVGILSMKNLIVLLRFREDVAKSVYSNPNFYCIWL